MQQRPLEMKGDERRHGRQQTTKRVGCSIGVLAALLGPYMPIEELDSLVADLFDAVRVTQCQPEQLIERQAFAENFETRPGEL